MRVHFPPPELRLAHQAIYRLPDAAGIALTCREGVVWVTLDNDPRDVVLEPGDVFSTQEHRRALVYAIEPSRIGLARAQPEPRPAPGHAGSLGTSIPAPGL